MADKRSLALLFLGLLAGGAGAAESETKVVETLLELVADDNFEGSEHRQDVANAAPFIQTHDIASAWQALAPALTYCDTRISDDKVTYVSVSTNEEAALFTLSHDGNSSLVFIDMACPVAYKNAAFLAVEAGDQDKAFKFLGKAQNIAPYWAEPYAERAYLIGSMGDNAKALLIYRQALDIASKHKSSSYARAVALRGIGYVLTELGDLAGARKAYEDSLVIDPESQLAKDELLYIERLQGK